MDHQIRLAAFQWLEHQTMLYYDEVLPRRLLEEGFIFEGKRITLIGPKGIWKPRFMNLPLSITTTSESPGGISKPVHTLPAPAQGIT